jgi:hypothetical protein
MVRWKLNVVKCIALIDKILDRFIGHSYFFIWKVFSSFSHLLIGSIFGVYFFFEFFIYSGH